MSSIRNDEFALRPILSCEVKLLLLLLTPLLPTATEIASKAARCLSKLSFEIGRSTDRKFVGEFARIDERWFGEFLGDEVLSILKFIVIQSFSQERV